MATRAQRAIDRLYKATANYVKVYGGNVSVIGGIQKQVWDSTMPAVYYIAIKCVGKEPIFPTNQKVKR